MCPIDKLPIERDEYFPDSRAQRAIKEITMSNPDRHIETCLTTHQPTINELHRSLNTAHHLLAEESQRIDLYQERMDEQDRAIISMQKEISNLNRTIDNLTVTIEQSKKESSDNIATADATLTPHDEQETAKHNYYDVIHGDEQYHPTPSDEPGPPPKPPRKHTTRTRTNDNPLSPNP